MLQKAANFIVNKKLPIFLLMVALAAVCFFMMLKVEVNEDMTKYLPNDSSMRQGIDIMEAEFPETETPSTIRVMFDDLTEPQKEEIRNRLAAIEYVESVTYDPESSDYNKDNHTLYVISTPYEYKSEEERSIESKLDKAFIDHTVVWHNDFTGNPGVSVWVLLFAVSMLVVILLLMCGSWIEPFLFLVVIGVAIVINMGTNLVKGSISDVTFSIAAVLQLVLSMDYSIILMNRYRQERRQEADKDLAMKKALAHAFSSVAASSLTTVAGLLMLTFMSFKIGMDLGIVLAKGVFISMVCVVTMLPGLILVCDGLIARTEKKTLRIPVEWAAAFSHKLRYLAGLLLIGLFIGAYFLQSQTGIAYTLATKDPVAEVFPAENPVIVLYENKDEDRIGTLVEKLESDENVKSVAGYANTLAKPCTADELTEEIGDGSGDVPLNADIIKMLYYDHFTGGKTGTMTAGGFLHLASEAVTEDAAFTDYVDEDMKDNAGTMERFADAEFLTTPKTAEELADFFGLNVSEIKDLFLYYHMQKDDIPTGTMTLPDFTDFVLREVAKEPEYRSMFDEDSLNGLRKLATFTDTGKMTGRYYSKGIASLLGMEEEQAKMIFVYYFANAEGFDPGTMTLPDYVSFLETDVMNDPAFAGYLDEDTLLQIAELAQFTDKEELQMQRSPEELAVMLEMDESVVRTVFALKNAEDISGKTMTLAEFSGFLVNDMMKDPLFAPSFDEETGAQLVALNELIGVAALGQPLSAARMSQILSIDEDTMGQLYYLYFSEDPAFQKEVAAMTMTMLDFLDILMEQAPSGQQAKLRQMEQLIDLAQSGLPLGSADLAKATGMSEAEVLGIFAYESQVTGQEVNAMTLPDFLEAAVSLSPQDPQLQQLAQIVQLAASHAALDADTLASLFGIEASQARQIFGLVLAPQKSIALPDFTDFLVNRVLNNKEYAGYFTKEQADQLKQLDQIVQLAASKKKADTATLAKLFDLEESMVSTVFRLYFGGDISGKTMSLSELVYFLLGDPVMRGTMDADATAELQTMQNIISATLNDTGLSYSQLSNILGMEPEMTKILYTLRASESGINSWYLTPQELVNYLIDNRDTFRSSMGDEELSQLETLSQIINGSVSGRTFRPVEMAKLLEMEEDATEQLFLFYKGRHGDTTGWTLSVKEFIDFVNSDVLTNEEMAGRIGTETAEKLSSAQDLIDAVVSGKEYSAAEMAGLLSGFAEAPDEGMVELLYLYGESRDKSDPTWKMSIESFFRYMVDDVLKDPRFLSLIDEDMRKELLSAEAELIDAKAQLVSDRYSRLIITTVYPEESAETTAFLTDLNTRCKQNMNGRYHLIGNSVMNYEMRQSFNKELLFITLLTAIAIFLIVALTFRSLFIPLILVLLVQCGVFMTVSVIGLMSGSMYYLALLIVECILMGATIDYGILLTNYYCESRKTMPVKEALTAAYKGSYHTILTSGLILILVTAILGRFFEEPTIAAIVNTISIGALCATLLILFILPGVLAACDRVIVKRKKENS